ncbi:uncharacterized protein CTRU02_202242 [Colletotrichum truncatum]|uniref:Uncharacterized protein n=1 Tax=Colletotrichum truncatum TaxID=5467 RepID=A0ACC3ZJX1_COLTU|nr:uncharacterized protein CTRU02_01402 [Colletotrichum truncatum]KAF6799723.1 hypothetical protein CTRU02_01402 [Colletotrichum truncatum]
MITDSRIQGQNPFGKVVRTIQRRREDQAEGRGPPPCRTSRPEVSIQLCRVPQQQDRLPPIRGSLFLCLRRY